MENPAFIKKGRDINQKLNLTCGVLDSADSTLLAEFETLWATADEIWDRNRDEHAFRSYVSADYEEVFKALLGLRGQVLSVLEWGSGLGIVTIMASRMGFDAYGIEAEDGLVEFAETLAEQYGPQATFSHGSFIPDAFQWAPSNGDESIATFIDQADGYDQFDMELRDFDLIYSYPWPDEHPLYHNILKQYGGPGAMFLSYDAREGMDLIRLNLQD